jgi:hypothetical protein
VNRDRKFIFPQTASYYNVNGRRYPSLSTVFFFRGDGHRFITEEASLSLADTTFSLPVWNDVDGSDLIQVVNPFLAFLDVRKFLDGNQSKLNNSGYYIWNGNLNESFKSVFVGDIAYQYGMRYIVTTNPPLTMGDNPGLIPPLQSFFVEKKSPGTSLTNSVKMSPNWTTTDSPNTTGNTFTLRSSEAGEEPYVFRIKATQGDNTSYAVLHKNMYASPSYREEEDMQVLFFDEIPLTVYTVSPAQKELLSVNSSDGFSTGIPLGLRLKAQGEVRLDFSNSRTFSHHVYLKDKEKNNLEVDLQQTPHYTFTFTPKPDATGVTTLNDRFSLRFEFDPTGNEDVALPTADWTVSSGNGQIQVGSTSGVMNGLQLYNILGSVVYQDDAQSNEYLVPVAGQQTYIVKVKTGNEFKAKKIFVK